MLFLATKEHKYNFIKILQQKKKTEKEFLQENLEKKKLLMFWIEHGSKLKTQDSMAYLMLQNITESEKRFKLLKNLDLLKNMNNIKIKKPSSGLSTK